MLKVLNSELEFSDLAEQGVALAGPALFLAEPTLLLAKPALLLAEPSDLFAVIVRVVGGAANVRFEGRKRR